MRERRLWARRGASGGEVVDRPCAVAGCPRRASGIVGMCTQCKAGSRDEKREVDPIALGVRLDFHKITRGVCRRVFDGACDIRLCRFSMLNEHKTGPTKSSLPVVREPCLLDAADRGGLTLEDIGERMGITRERVRQIEVMALAKAERAAKARKL